MRLSRSVLAVGLWLAVSPIALAVGVKEGSPRRDETNNYSVSTWRLKDGLPSSVIWSIAQDPDGYLWVGTSAGLARFDGVRFVSWDAIGHAPLPKQFVRVITVARDGTLWIGYGEGDGGVTRIAGDRVQTYGATDGLGRGPVSAIVEDQAGTMWATSSSGLYRFTGTGWQLVRMGEGVSEKPTQTLFIDRDGQAYIATPSAVFHRPLGQDAFKKIEASEGFRGRMLRQDDSGSIWITDGAIGFRRLGKQTAPHKERGLGTALLHDRLDNLWIGTLGQGLWRASAAAMRPVVFRHSTLTGLSNDVVLSLFEDRDGNIWAGTNEGLNRLTPQNVTPITNVGNVSALTLSPGGDVWVANGRELIRFRSGRERLQAERHIALPGIRALHFDHSGHLWAVTSRQLLRVVNGRLKAMVLSTDHAPLTAIRFVSSDATGALWIGDDEQGVFRWRAGHLQPFVPPPGVNSAIATALYTDTLGRVWLVLDDGSLVVAEVDGSIHRYSPQQLAGDSRLVAIYEDSDHVMWLGGFGWLSRLDNGQFRTVTRTQGFPVGYVKAITEVGNEIWIAADAGIIRLRREAFAKAIADPTGQLRFNVYDTSDGLAGSPVFAGDRTAPKTPDGRLWFVTGKGITVVDPETLRGAGSHGPMRIEGMVADGHNVTSLTDARLPPRTTTIEITYTSVNLTAPHKARFRYRLKGFDADWVDAGARRTAFYTNLPARAYEFQVIGDNDDGTTSELGRPFEFAINPAFYQRLSFYAACVLALAVVGWALWRVRLLQLRREFSMVLGERLRMSREIHDTLLQGLFGVSLQLNALPRTIESSPALATERVSRLRALVDEYIRETRRSINDLRSPLLEDRNLETALRHIGEAATGHTSVSFEFTVAGTPRRFSADAEEQVLRIGQEALSNAVRHGGANRVHMTLRYQKRAVTLHVDDDGHGFEAAALIDTEGSHYGLKSMKARAERVGGSLRLVSVSGQGTRVEAIVPR